MYSSQLSTIIKCVSFVAHQTLSSLCPFSVPFIVTYTHTHKISFNISACKRITAVAVSPAL